MKTRDDALIEILTEELPSKSLVMLAQGFRSQMQTILTKSDCTFEAIEYFVTPRRLTLLIKGLISKQPDQVIERKGPALKAAFDASGKPTKACAGFARSLGVEPDQLRIIKTAQGEWVAYHQELTGRAITDLLPEMIDTALKAMPIKKPMRWGDGAESFVRPVHGVLMLYGNAVIPAKIFELTAGRVTYGHRFLTNEPIVIPTTDAYESLLESEGYVIANFEKRKEKIVKDALTVAQTAIPESVEVIFDEDLLNEVAGIVEWPVAACGTFDANFLALPEEVLVSAMQDHQRYFPVRNQQGLTRYFIIVSNIISTDLARVIHGNERVLRARLADAEFFFTEDKKETLAARLNRLKGMIYQAQLGTLYDKAKRLEHVAGFFKSMPGVDEQALSRAALLAKTDLTTHMVNEFPELQGIMGAYYAEHDGESAAVADAIKTQYLPKVSGGELPETPMGQYLALIDKVDTLIGYFGLDLLPSGEKDPYGLKRAGIGIIRLIIENQLQLNIKDLLNASYESYQIPLKNIDAVNAVFNFLYERLRAWYLDQGIAADVFAAVAALSPEDFADFHQRLLAVSAFKKLPAAESLSVANKRVGNILNKSDAEIKATVIDAQLFESSEEKNLADALATQHDNLRSLSAAKQYEQMLLKLAQLREPVDAFFDHVMVMTDDIKRRDNRLLLLKQLRELFLQVADIALLQ